MKIIDEHGNEMDEGCLVEEVTNQRTKKSKLTRIPDKTPLLVLRTRNSDGKIVTGDKISFRDLVLSKLKFPTQAFHEVSKYQLQDTRIADPIAFLLDSYEDGTHVQIDFYKSTYVVTVVWETKISRICAALYSENSSKFNLRYDLEQSKSGIDMIKQFILSTMDAPYVQIHNRYYD